MANDGTIKIGTELDKKGLTAGLSKLGGLAERSISGLTKAIGAVSAGLAVAGTAAIKTGIEWESAFAGVKKTVDATDEQLSRLSDGLRALSHEIPESAAGLAEIAEAAGQLGIETDNILGFTETMANLGVATNMSATEAATSLAKLANITGMSQTDFDRLGSTIVALGNNLATTEADITAMSMRIAGAGSQVGLTEAQILSFSGALSSVGIEAEAGGTAFSTLISKMSLASAKGGEKLEQFASVAGMSADEFKTAFEKDAAGAISAFITGLGKINEEGGSAIGVLDNMGLSDIRMRDALLRAAGASGVFTKALELGTDAWEENTALAKEASQRYETVESRIQLLKNAANDLGIEIYEGIQEPLKGLLNKGTKYIGQLSIAFKQSGLEGMVSELGAVFADVSKQVAKAAPQLVKAATSAIQSFLKGIQENLPEIAQAAVKTVTALIEGIISMLPDLIETGMQMLIELMKGFAEALPDLIPKAIDALVDAIVDFISDVPALLEAGVKIVAAIAEGIITAIPRLLEGIGEFIMRITDVVDDEMIAIREKGEEIRDELSDIREQLDETKDGIDEQTGSIDKQSEMVDAWIGRLKELEKKSRLTKEEQNEWNVTIGKLKQVIPEVSDLINDQTGEIEGGTQALEKQADAWEANMKAEAYANIAKESFENLARAQTTLAEAEENQKAAKLKANAAQQEYNLALRRAQELTQSSSDDMSVQIELLNAMASSGGAAAGEAYDLANSLGGLAERAAQAGDDLADTNATLADAQTVADDAEADYNRAAGAAEDAATKIDRSASDVAKAQGKWRTDTNTAALGFKEALGKMVGYAKNNKGEVTAEMRETAKNTLSAFDNIPAEMEGVAKNILLGLVGGLEDDMGITDAATMSAEELLNAIKNYLGIASPSKATAEVGKYTMLGLKDGIVNNTEGVRAAMNTTGLMLIAGLKNGMNGQLPSLIAAAKNIAGQVITAMRERMDIHSPSKETQKIGEFVSEGLAKGIKNKEKSVQKAAKEVADKATKSIKEARSSYKKEAKYLKAEYRENLADLKEDHTKALDDIEKDYQKTLENIANNQTKMRDSVSGFAGLFDAPKMDDAIGAQEILANAKAQTEQVQDFFSVIEALKKRNIPQEIIDQFVDMGPEATEQLKAFNAMTDAQLAEYITMYEKRKATAATLAQKQYEDERAAAKTAYETAKAEENAAYEKAKAEEKERYEKDLAKLQKDLERQLEKVGSAMKKGLIKGAKMSDKEAKKVSDNLTKGIIKKVKKELGIASPSKVFAEMGMYSSKGLGLGFTKTLPSTFAEMKKAIAAQMSIMPAGAFNVTAAAGSSVSNSSKYTITQQFSSPIPMTTAEEAKAGRIQAEKALFKLGVQI